MRNGSLQNCTRLLHQELNSPSSTTATYWGGLQQDFLYFWTGSVLPSFKIREVEQGINFSLSGECYVTWASFSADRFPKNLKREYPYKVFYLHERTAHGCSPARVFVDKNAMAASEIFMDSLWNRVDLLSSCEGVNLIWARESILRFWQRRNSILKFVAVLKVVIPHHEVLPRTVYMTIAVEKKL